MTPTPTGWKRQLVAAGLGVVILGAVLGCAFFVSSDMRLVYALGAILLFGSALGMGARGRGDWITLALLSLPLLLVFGLLVFHEMPVLWPHVLLWAIAAIVGWFLLRGEGAPRLWRSGAAALFIAASFWYGLSVVPTRVARALTHLRNTAAPAFAFTPVSSGAVPTEPTAGKVLVIDFFSTTCGPCIAELPKLAQARAELRDSGDIEFVVVASDAGGDTPERFKSFIERRHVALPLAFDPGGKAHDAFGFSGVPALVVLDRTGRVRLTHQGYNASETSFRRDLVQFLRAL